MIFKKASYCLSFIFLVAILFSSTIISDSDSTQFPIIIIPQQSILSQGEVFQADVFIQDPISDPKKQDIRLYHETGILHIMAPFFSKIEESHYFLYFEMPPTAVDGNYILKIENIPVIIDNVLQEVTGTANITSLTESPMVSITPGFFHIPGQKSGQIIITAESKDIQTALSFTVPDFITHPYSTEQYINPGTSRKFMLNYDTSPLEQDVIESISINYGAKIFTIPVFITGISSPEAELLDAIEFFIEGESFKKDVDPDKVVEGYIKMANKFNETLKDVKLSLSGDLSEIISITPSEFQELQPLSNFSTYMKINEDRTPQKQKYSGELIMESEGYFSALSIIINIDLPDEEQEYIVEELLPSEEEDISPTEEKPKTESVIKEIFPFDVPEEFQEKATAPARPFIYLIFIMLVLGILTFLLSGKKKEKKKKFSEVIKEAEKK